MMSSMFLSLAKSGGNERKAPLEIIVFSMTNNRGSIALLSVVVQELSNCCYAFVLVLVFRTNNSANQNLDDKLLLLISYSESSSVKLHSQTRKILLFATPN